MPGFLFLVLAVLAGCQPMAYRDNDEIHWRDLAAGQREAARRHLPVLVDFHVSVHCPRCEAMDQGAYADPQVIRRVNESFVPVRINLLYPLNEEEEALMAGLGNDGECVLAFLAPDGTVLREEDGTLIGSMATVSPPELLRYLDRALARLAALSPAGSR